MAHFWAEPLNSCVFYVCVRSRCVLSVAVEGVLTQQSQFRYNPRWLHIGCVVISGSTLTYLLTK